LGLLILLTIGVLIVELQRRRAEKRRAAMLLNFSVKSSLFTSSEGSSDNADLLQYLAGSETHIQGDGSPMVRKLSLPA
jgi:hypothetical protein